MIPFVPFLFEDEEILNFFNEMIMRFNETGKLQEIQNKYLGDCNSI